MSRARNVLVACVLIAAVVLAAGEVSTAEIAAAICILAGAVTDNPSRARAGAAAGTGDPDGPTGA